MHHLLSVVALLLSSLHPGCYAQTEIENPPIVFRIRKKEGERAEVTLDAAEPADTTAVVAREASPAADDADSSDRGLLLSAFRRLWRPRAAAGSTA